MNRRHWLGAAWLASQAAQASDAPTAPGRLERLPTLPSGHVDSRPVDVWLPPGYSPQRACKVLYMHDGQMLFDASTTWNGQAWHVDLALAALMRSGQLQDTLVVAVWNNGPLRRSEYFPEKFLPHVPEPARSRFTRQGLQGRPRADAYLRFLVEELKPLIDARYATRPGPQHCMLMGSSMGGLISLYAMCEYPQVFGGVAGLSTHWPGATERNVELPLAAFTYLRDHLPPADGRRLYLDHGTTELDAQYPPSQAFVNEIVRARGYTASDSALRVFEGEGHNERAWARRLHIPLQFLLGQP